MPFWVKGILSKQALAHLYYSILTQSSLTHPSLIKPQVVLSYPGHYCVCFSMDISHQVYLVFSLDSVILKQGPHLVQSNLIQW